MKKTISADMQMPNITETTCDVGWVVVDACLDGLETSANQLFDDPEFKRMFDELRRYTDRQLYGDEKSHTIEMELTLYRENI